MKIRTAGRHLREGTKSLIRNGWMTFASVSSIAISLFILGVFLLVALNVNQFVAQLENQVTITVYLDVDTKPAKATEIQNQIGNFPLVKKVTFVPKEEGLEFLRENMGAQGEEYLEGSDGDNNPLPDAIKVEVTEPRNVEEVAEQIEEINKRSAIPPIMKIDYAKATVETLFKLTRIVRNVGLVLVVGLMVTAMFLIANTIKLTILARSREISIMKLVGATNSFIRWPFFVEGALLGLIGSIIPIAVLLFGYSELLTWSEAELGLLMIKLMTLKQVGMSIGWLLAGIGIVIGVWGSTLSVRKFLKV